MEKILSFIVVLIFVGCTNNTESSKSDIPLKQISFNHVKLEDNFWKPRLDIQAKTLIPYAFEKTLQTDENLKKSCKLLKRRHNRSTFSTSIYIF